MYLKSATPKKKANWRLRNWLILALIYALTGLIWLNQEHTIMFLEEAPTPTVVVVEEEDTKDKALELLERGDIYLDQGNQTAALESYQEAVAANPDLAIAYARWGLLLTLQTKMDEALSRTELAVSLAPNDPEVLSIHAMALEWSGDLPGAIQYAQQAIDLNPEYATAYAFLAEAYVDSGRIDEALSMAQQAIEVNPDEMWGLAQFGLCL